MTSLLTIDGSAFALVQKTEKQKVYPQGAHLMILESSFTNISPETSLVCGRGYIHKLGRARCLLYSSSRLAFYLLQIPG